MYDGNYYILLNDNKIQHVQSSISAIEINFLLEKQLHPGKDYNSYAIAPQKIKSNVIREIKKGKKDFLNLTSDRYETFENFEDFSLIYVIIAKCTSCELKTMVSDLKIRNALEEGKKLIIFPVYANESQLESILKKEQVEFPVYLDYKDHFNLFSIITNPNAKMIILENSDLNRAVEEEIGK